MKPSILVVLRFVWIASAMWLLCCQQSHASSNEKYAVVIDAGSTGTRAFVYKIEIGSAGGRVVHGYSCGKERLGLSSFANNPSDSTHMLMTLLERAADIVPSHLQAQTRLYVKGTAGMRLLSEEIQETIWDTLVYSLQNRNDVQFKISRKHFGTISGHQEAFYAVLASNYIFGSIDGDLRQIEGTSMVGALDMGGSSNQLVIYNGTNRSEKMKDSHFWSHSWLRYGAELVRERLLKHIYDSHTAAASASASAAAITTSAATEGLVDASSSSKANSTQQVLYLHNPCANLDYYDVYTENCIFVGTGHARDCLSQLERIIWSEEEDIGALKENLLHLAAHNSDTKFAADSLEADKTEAEKEADIEVALESSSATVEGIFEGGGEGEEEGGGGGGLSGHHIPGPSRCVRGPCPIDSVVHPSVAGQHFYAMSVYFYALDCVRELGPEPLPHWPNPSIAELRVAADRYCAMPWSEVDAQYRVHRGHAYTYSSQLPYRCLEALYIVTLLEKGFGFDKDARDITLALEVGGKEVEWTLGFVLAEVDIPVSSSFENHSAPDPASLTSTLPILNPNHHPQEADDGLKDLKTAVRRLALANEFIAQMESTAQEVVVRCRSWQEQYTLLVKQFIGW